VPRHSLFLRAAEETPRLSSQFRSSFGRIRHTFGATKGRAPSSHDEEAIWRVDYSQL